MHSGTPNLVARLKIRAQGDNNMRFKTIAFTAAATLVLAACGHKAATTDATDTTVTTTDANATAADTNMTATAPSSGQGFANAAAASDAFEISTSKLALTMSKSASLKKFAQKMIDAHTDSTAKLKAAAASASPAITPDPALTPDQQQALDGMKAMMGAAFDKAYVEAQVAGHQKTLDALRAYSATGDVISLKSFATSLIPTVAAHLNMAKGLKP
jgi:putative membrane protein